jgi:signal peptidase II
LRALRRHYRLKTPDDTVSGASRKGMRRPCCFDGGSMSVTLSFILAGGLFACDQLIKLWAIEVLAPTPGIVLIPGVLGLTYVENYGAAFGIFQGQRALLTVVAGLVLAAACWALASGRLKRPVERLSAALILAGGAGNLFDRVLRGYVVDYIDINQLFSYPMFNLADCCVVIGALLMAAAILWEDRRLHRTGE